MERERAEAIARTTERLNAEAEAEEAAAAAGREQIAVITERAIAREREALIARWAAEQAQNVPPGVVTEDMAEEGRLIQFVMRLQAARRAANVNPTSTEGLWDWLHRTRKLSAELNDELKGIGETVRENEQDWKGWLGDARRWMQLLGVETDTFAGKLLNAAQAFFDFGGGIGGIAGGLASLLGIDLGGVVNSVGRWVRNALGDIGDFLGLADGGTITMPGTVLVGERGPELLTLPRGAQVTPLDRAGGTIVVPVYLDGREIARATLPHQAREMQLRGVTS